MCGIGTWQYAFTEESGMVRRSKTIVEQCDHCGDYRRKQLDELPFEDDEDE